MYGLGETWRIPSLFHLLPLTHEISWDKRVTRVPTDCTAKTVRHYAPSAEYYYSGYFPVAALLACLSQSDDLSLALIYIGKEKGTENRQNRLSEIPALSRGLVAGWAAQGLSLIREEGNPEQQNTECPGVSWDAKPEKHLHLIPQWLWLSSRTKLDLIAGSLISQLCELGKALHLSDDASMVSFCKMEIIIIVMPSLQGLWRK